jgi:hypothetical protein
MNGQRWRKAGVAVALSIALAAPLQATPPPREAFFADPELATEYYNAELGEFVITASVDETKVLDAGSTPGWERTHFSFYVRRRRARHGSGERRQPDGRARVPVLHPACVAFPVRGGRRVRLGRCEHPGRRAREPGCILCVASRCRRPVPSVDRGCRRRHADPRISHVGQRAGHRASLTTVKELRDAMVVNGWIAEGYGPDGVAMCVPT